MKKTLILVTLLFLFTIPVFVGIFHPGFFLTDDGNWMVIRLSAFYEALRQGQFPVRFLPRLNNGYGYPVADFLYPSFLYLGSFIHLLHISFTMTIKVLFSFSLIASVIGSFLWLKKQFGIVGGLVGSLVYTLFPYHVWDITKRGSLGEVLALGIVPFIFLFIDSGNILLTAPGVSLLILSHNSLALLFLPIFFFYVFLEKKIKTFLFSFFLGLGLSAFFWIPALFDTQFTVFSKTLVSNFSKYFLSSQLYPLIGIVSFFVILFSLSLVYKKMSSRVVFFLVITLLSISLTNKVSFPLWSTLQLGKYIQFPFRFLSLTTLGVGFLAAYIVYTQKKYRFILAAVIVILLYVSSWQFFLGTSYQQHPDSYYTTNQDSTTVQNEYMPVWARKLNGSTVEKVNTSSKAIVSNIVDRGSSISFQVTTKQRATLTIAKLYFPGWQGSLDNKPVTIVPSNPFGFITVMVPPGIHVVSLHFGETPFRILADGITVVSLITFGVLCTLRKKGIVHV